MMLRQLLRFSLIGALATVLHMAVGVTLIHAGWSPLLANVFSFLVAFLVSFMGHYGFSFPGHGMTLSTSLKRFVLVAVCGFMVNETLLAGLVRFSSIPGIWCLIISTSTAAILTFAASRSWVFCGVEHAPSTSDRAISREAWEP